VLGLSTVSSRRGNVGSGVSIPVVLTRDVRPSPGSRAWTLARPGLDDRSTRHPGCLQRVLKVIFPCSASDHPRSPTRDRVANKLMKDIRRTAPMYEAEYQSVRLGCMAPSPTVSRVAQDIAARSVPTPLPGLLWDLRRG